jgi:quercetin dioxygenase-like cupin family protein
MQVIVARSFRWVLLGVLLIASISLNGTPPQGQLERPIKVTQVLTNDRVGIIRVTFAPGAHEPAHAFMRDTIVIQATAGDIELTVDGNKTAGHEEPGKVWYLSKDGPGRDITNLGNQPFDWVVISLK